VKIVIGSDHGGFELKEELKNYLTGKDISVEDLGNEGLDSVDYPDYAASVADKISKSDADAGILVCGTGLGMCITANKFKGVRAAVLSDEFTAQMAKAHNNANVICLGGRTQTVEHALKLVSIWLETEYEGGRNTHAEARATDQNSRIRIGLRDLIGDGRRIVGVIH